MASEKPMALRCSAHSKQTGAPCKQPAIAGGTVCRFHGGASPQVKAAADRRLIEAAESIKEMLPAATRELERLVSSGKGDGIRLQAVRDVLDRAGLAVVRKNEVKVSEGEYTFTIESAADDYDVAL